MTLKFSIFSTNFIQNNFAEKRKFKFKYSMDFRDLGIAVMLQANVYTNPSLNRGSKLAEFSNSLFSLFSG